MLAKNGTIIESTSKSDENSIEVLTAELRGITITSVYKPPPTPFLMPEIPSPGKPRTVIGDFNSYSSQWGYYGNNNDGNAVEAWAETNQLYLIHEAKQPKSFNSCRWKAGYNTDIAFVSHNISGLSKKLVLKPLAKTQHRPIGLTVNAAVSPATVPSGEDSTLRKRTGLASKNNLKGRSPTFQQTAKTIQSSPS